VADGRRRGRGEEREKTRRLYLLVNHHWRGVWPPSGVFLPPPRGCISRCPGGALLQQEGVFFFSSRPDTWLTIIRPKGTNKRGLSQEEGFFSPQRERNVFSPRPLLIRVHPKGLFLRAFSRLFPRGVLRTFRGWTSFWRHDQAFYPRR